LGAVVTLAHQLEILPYAGLLPLQFEPSVAGRTKSYLCWTEVIRFVCCMDCWANFDD
jgi:hypothetical protein